IAWSGSSCNGAEGGDVPCGRQCVNFQDRHSFSVSRTNVPAGGSHCLSVFFNADCTDEVGLYLNNGGGNCIGVNTGTNVQSFKCFPGNAC
ncbi:hypothetical protein C8J56DRAFT_799850, partial [Mycena floridula]